MKLKTKQTVEEIAALIDGNIIGDQKQIVSGINEIHRVEKGDLVFVDHPKYYKKALTSAATIILIDTAEVEVPEGKVLIVVEKPFDAYNKLTKHFSPFIAPTGNIGKNTTVDASALIFPNVFIGNNVTIGANVVLHAGCVIMDNTTLEENVIIGANTVVGHYAFYYKKKEDGYHRMHSCGGVLIKKNAEIGALCTIDAGVSAITTIGIGTKLDNQVHIGHDTIIGDYCLFAANVGVAGCVTIENKVTLWGQVGCASDVVLGEGCTVMAQSGIGKSLEPGKSYFGTPCKEVRSAYRELAALKKLPEILETL
ncbi:MAG: LpxD N-terminal domain-containing protein [Lishizhenia sp.]